MLLLIELVRAFESRRRGEIGVYLGEKKKENGPTAEST